MLIGEVKRMKLREEDLLICRICEQKVKASDINEHCIKCYLNAEGRKRILELNLEMASVCEAAY
jgi:hypothetical protein